MFEELASQPLYLTVLWYFLQKKIVGLSLIHKRRLINGWNKFYSRISNEGI